MDRDVTLIAAFESHQRSRSFADNTIRGRSSVLRSLTSRSGRTLLEVDLADLRDHIGRPGIKPGTRRTERAALIAFFTFALDERYREDDPTRRLAPVRVPRSKPRPYTAEQVDKLLGSGSYRRTRAMIILGFFQGFRASSIAPVHGHDIDLDEMTIRTVGKGGKERVLPLHPMVAELAREMPRDDWWFPARRGRNGHIQPHSVSDLMHEAKKRAGITDPHLTGHSLRHGFGTGLVEEGVDIRVIQELMMHESLTSTQIYTGVSRRLKRDAIRALPARQIPQHSGRGTATATHRIAA